MISYRERLQEEGCLVLDGAMGTMLQAGGLEPGACPELLNRTKPDLVLSVHRAYAEAGCDILVTNSFGANRIKLAEYGLQDAATEFNLRAAEIARKASEGRCLVAGSVGPTGRFIEPLGDLSFQEALEVFAHHMEALAQAGVDAFHLETFSDLAELKAALMAARQVTDLPVAAFMTFQADGRTITGTDPETFAVVAEALGAEVVGINCGLGPEAMEPLVEVILKTTERPVAAMPNAGLPKLVHGRTVFPGTPGELAFSGQRLVALGVKVIGGCCGTRPEHIEALARAVRGLVPPKAQIPKGLAISSRTRTVWLGANWPVRLIGERINPTGRPKLAEALRKGDWSALRSLAQSQASQGAELLDVNVGVPGLDEPSLLRKAVEVAQEAADLPLVLDSPNPAALEAGLRACAGKPIINSVTGDASSLEKIIPLAVRYGAALIGLTLDEKGIPERAEDRLAVARRILEAAEASGLPKRDLIIDPLTLTVSAQPEQAQETLRALRLIKEELGVATVLGISNISFGLPNRKLLNRTFLAQAVSFGLDCAIADPGDEELRQTLQASSLIVCRQTEAALLAEGQKPTAKPTPPPDIKCPEVWQAVVAGEKDQVVAKVEKTLMDGLSAQEIISQALSPALEEVGRLFETGKIYLPQMLLCAETAQKALERLKSELGPSDQPSQGRILLATVKGDIHDIGKNIVRTLLENRGYEIIDLGKNVPAEVIVEEARIQKVDLIGLSALMTTTMVEMKTTIELLRSRGLSVPVAVGGAVVTEDFAREIGAQVYAKDAAQALERIGQCLKTSDAR